VPDFSIAGRWHGVYAKHFESPYVRFHPRKSMLKLLPDSAERV
jgi:hypothetical protein